MISKQEVQTLKQILDGNRSFILTTHVNPDGDGLGSELALAEYLKQRKKSVRIVNCSPVPVNFHFLDERRMIEVYSQERHIEALTSADVLIILDISDWGRLREFGELAQTMHFTKICIDHHLVGSPFADIDIIHPEASSTGELIYELLHGLGAKMNKAMCEAIYTAILTDTGSFRFSNTSARVHEIAGQLLESGVNASEIYTRVYDSQSLERIKLMAKVLSSLEVGYEGQLAWMCITQDMLKATGATLKDSDGLSDFPRTIAGVEVSLLFVELEDGRVKISFRSKGRVKINGVAQEFGGGGHAFASGATTNGPLQKTMTEVIQRTGALLPALPPERN